MKPDVEALDLDEDTALVVWRRDASMSEEVAFANLEALAEEVHDVAPNAIVVCLPEGHSLETLSDADMAAHGWVRNAKSENFPPHS